MTVRQAILRRVRKARPDAVFTPAEFGDLGTPYAVGMALARLVRAGTLRRIGRGFYDVPRKDPVLGTYAPDLDALSRALADRHGIRLQPTGAHAANLLGLTEQVPMRIAYLTDGTPRTLRIGNRQIVLRRTTPRRMAAAGRISGLVIHALRWLGRPHVTADLLRPLRGRLDGKAKRQLLADAHLAPAWAAEWMRRLARGEK
jgi:hypothetical protein